MKALIRVVLAISLASTSATGYAANPDKNIRASVYFVGEGVAAADTQEQTITNGAIFGVTRLRALESATLQEDVSLADYVYTKPAKLEKGARLFLAGFPNATGGMERPFFCGEYQLGKVTAMLNGQDPSQWICLDDSDQDGLFDKAGYAEGNKGTSVPSFSKITELKPIHAAYSKDEADQRAFFDVAIAYKAGNRSLFRVKVKKVGTEEWRDLTTPGSGVAGSGASIPLKIFPVTFPVDSWNVTVLEKNGDDIKVKLDRPAGEIVSYDLQRIPRY